MWGKCGGDERANERLVEGAQVEMKERDRRRAGKIRSTVVVDHPCRADATMKDMNVCGGILLRVRLTLQVPSSMQCEEQRQGKSH